MSEKHGFMKALKCRECGREYPLTATHVCEFDFGPLEVAYDYDRIKKSLTARHPVAPQNHVALPRAAAGRRRTDRRHEVGFTPLIKADRLAKALGIRELWIKNDAVNYPTLSFKDRVVSVALSRAKELGFETVACASTGNLANSVAANAASAGLKAYVFIPSDLEQGKILNSLIYGANVIGIKGPLRRGEPPLRRDRRQVRLGVCERQYAPVLRRRLQEHGYEIAEQLGWRAPQHTVVRWRPARC
jgi:threonine synthase